MNKAINAHALAWRIEVLSAELRVALAATDTRDLQRWGWLAAEDFGRAGTRRARNLLSLLKRLGSHGRREVEAAFEAYRAGRLRDHFQDRALFGQYAAEYFLAQTGQTVTALSGTLKRNPKESVPQLITTVVVSVLVSGGPDGNGGAPDLDLLVGIGAHRSILSHSIIMGSAIEAGFLSIVRLVQLVHGKLPKVHDPLWNVLKKHADSLGSAAITGAGLGMAYHLLVDGLEQPAPYKDLPISMPMPAHQAIFVGNAFMEAQDVLHKEIPPGVKAADPASASTVQDQHPNPSSIPWGRADADSHRRFVRMGMEVGSLLEAVMPRERVDLLRRHGAWLQALADGELVPTTPAQEHFIKVARGLSDPESDAEVAWVERHIRAWLLMRGSRWRLWF